MWVIISLVTILTLFVFCRQRATRKVRYTTQIKIKPTPQLWEYSKLKSLVHADDLRLPLMFVDLDIFDANTNTLLDMVRGTGKTLRIATKSVRCPYLIKRIAELGKGVVNGFMCYSLEEAELLADEGLNDFYVAYPTFQKSDILLAFKLLRLGKKVTLTIDSIEQINRLDEICGENEDDRGLPTKLRVCVDLDLSYKLFGGAVHLGAHRSKLSSVHQFHELTERISESSHVILVGVMGYEAHVAGLPDDSAFPSFPNFLVRFFKKYLFYNETLRIRKEISNYCKAKGIQLEFFNGGGTGNLEDVSRDPAVSEVSAGSGFLQAQLFDYYVQNKCSPALCFALQATRVHEDYIVCQSGGFIASGTCGVDKFPTPFSNPLRLAHYESEGYGEVQTPLRVLGRSDDVNGVIDMSDPVLFRPAKSGEIAEHFKEYVLIKDYKIVDKLRTYRGLGHAFY